MIYNAHLLPKLRSDRILIAVRGLPCTLRIASFVPGHGCAHNATVVPCHVRCGGKGMGTKESDFMVVAGCQHCHDLLDGRDSRAEVLMQKYPAGVLQRVISAIWETQTLLISQGAIVIPDAVWTKGMLPEIRVA